MIELYNLLVELQLLVPGGVVFSVRADTVGRKALIFDFRWGTRSGFKNNHLSLAFTLTELENVKASITADRIYRLFHAEYSQWLDKTGQQV